MAKLRMSPGMKIFKKKNIAEVAMRDFTKIEIKNIEVTSVFRFFGGIFLIMGIIIGLFSNILRVTIVSPEIVRIFPFLAGLQPGIVAGVLLGFVYGFSAGLGFSILALLYNFFAALLGGIKVYTKEREDKIQ
ncbi:MAG: hypothetical protein JW800_03555 [Candidatus Omnitrophica bacterium]|nr:hypothetical protein [Candidatus Omnitrophota bacterium]